MVTIFLFLQWNWILFDSCHMTHIFQPKFHQVRYIVDLSTMHNLRTSFTSRLYFSKRHERQIHENVLFLQQKKSVLTDKYKYIWLSFWDRTSEFNDGYYSDYQHEKPIHLIIIFEHHQQQNPNYLYWISRTRFKRLFSFLTSLFSLAIGNLF